MPVIQVTVPEGALSQDQKQEVVARITDVMVDVERLPERLRTAVTVLVQEVPDGGWGIGGKAFDRDGLRALIAGEGAPS